MHDPTTPTEWQEAVDSAELCLLIDSARQYGLVTGGPDIDVARCEQILAAGWRLGFSARSHAELLAEAFVASAPDALSAAGIEHVDAGVAAFEDDMRKQGIHVGVNGTCVCGQPWPCDAATKATS